jgi:hypothetical protein
MNTQVETLHSSPATLAKATGGALAAAALILVLFVLPAETGYDPTGSGKALGLTAMAENKAKAGEAPIAAPIAAPGNEADSRAAIARTAPYRSDERTFTLAPHSGIELKARMTKGDSLVFRWEAKGGPVKMDMHGDPLKEVGGETATYWKQLDLTEAQGAFTAGFAGQHGWYWRNKGEVPVTITLKTAGFYKEIFQPEG